MSEICPYCGGACEVTCPTCRGYGTDDHYFTCTDCGGSGKVTCPNCSGMGEFEIEDKWAY